MKTSCVKTKKIPNQYTTRTKTLPRQGVSRPIQTISKLWDLNHCLDHNKMFICLFMRVWKATERDRKKCSREKYICSFFPDRMIRSGITFFKFQGDSSVLRIWLHHVLLLVQRSADNLCSRSRDTSTVRHVYTCIQWNHAAFACVLRNCTGATSQCFDLPHSKHLALIIM